MEEYNYYGSVGYYKDSPGVFTFQPGENLPARSGTGVIVLAKFNSVSTVQVPSCFLYFSLIRIFTEAIFIGSFFGLHYSIFDFWGL